MAKVWILSEQRGGAMKNIGTKSINMSDIMVYLAIFSTIIDQILCFCSISYSNKKEIPQFYFHIILFGKLCTKWTNMSEILVYLAIFSTIIDNISCFTGTHKVRMSHWNSHFYYLMVHSWIRMANISIMLGQ